MEDLNFESVKIKDITFKSIIIELCYDSLVYSKLLSRFTEDTDNLFLFAILNGAPSSEYLTRCSKDLTEKGMNCYFITHLVMQLGIKKSVLGGVGGEGLFGLARFHIKSDDMANSHYREKYESNEGIYEKV